MANLTNYHENIIMDRSFRGTDAPPAPLTLYVGLHTADPTETGEANEVTAADYARQGVANADWGGIGSNVENALEVDFGTATSNWGTITHFSIWNGDQATVGANSLWYAALTTAKPIESGDRPRFTAGSLTFATD